MRRAAAALAIAAVLPLALLAQDAGGQPVSAERDAVIATIQKLFDGTAAHDTCGIDAFDLVKTEEGWKIAGGVFTIERRACAPSPLGEPKRHEGAC